ncbi:hypothetical protein Q2T41_16965 [Maribacter confluentis]|uniref:PD-(D/E)XK nuclease superfamily protein n=1 Tax=Maribacter confluentis TaxID=1656093 RepID=A0ABT8RUP2_9FLAO|nr:PD-(D/E)XK nuclease family protein [Maribacter confluentis]MDO1514348.1 hypothetical protein [Maribacter confluentis]
MFNSLYNLFRNNSNKSPLEDFTTEGFANILKMYPEILSVFCVEFLELPEDNYSIETQYYQALISGDTNCIVDMVFIGKQNVCFIENKVESSEGFKQLERYVSALHLHHSGKNMYLKYCTKYADPKTVENVGVFFSQFRWYQIAKFLRSFEGNPLVKSYLEFLNNYKMSQDNTLKSENLVAMENLSKTIEIAEFHIDNSKPQFIELFGYTSLNKNFNWDQIKAKNRICYYVDSALPSISGQWSEILYAIEFNNLKMIVQIYLDKNHESFNSINEITITGDFVKTEFDSGIAIQLKEDLGKYLNNSNADKEIQAWFVDSFKQLYSFIENHRELNWTI